MDDMTMAVADATPPALLEARAHEVFGSGALAFAALQAGRRQGPVIWIEGPGAVGRLDPYGLAPFCDPARLILIDAPTQKEAFWAMEEALRSGAAPTVIAATGAAADLTQGRRLLLAAEAGAALVSAEETRDRQTGAKPLALLLAPEGAASSAMETRWRADPAPSWAEGAVAPRWIWTLLKNKRGALGAWTIEADPSAASGVLVLSGREAA